MIAAGVMVAISVAGTWAAAGGGMAPREMEQHRGSTAPESRRDPWVNPVKVGERIASEAAVRLFPPIRFLGVGFDEGDAFRDRPSASSQRAGAASAEKLSQGGRGTNFSGTPGGEQALLMSGGRIRPGERSFPPSGSVRDDSPVSGWAFGAHPGGAAGMPGFLVPGNGERTVSVSPGTSPWALIADQRRWTSPDSPGPETEEPFQPGPVAGLLCVVAVAGALAGRSVVYPAGKRGVGDDRVRCAARHSLRIFPERRYFLAPVARCGLPGCGEREL